MTASAETLGDLHASLAAVFAQMLAVREEPVIANGELVLKDGEPLMRKVFPTAAEVAAVTAFLKNNNITAVQGNESKLAELQKQLSERRAGKAVPKAAPWAAPDVHAAVPNPDTPWQ